MLFVFGLEWAFSEYYRVDEEIFFVFRVYGLMEFELFYYLGIWMCVRVGCVGLSV